MTDVLDDMTTTLDTGSNQEDDDSSSQPGYVRRIIKHLAQQGYAYGQISEQIGMSPSAVKVFMCRTEHEMRPTNKTYKKLCDFIANDLDLRLINDTEILSLIKKIRFRNQEQTTNNKNLNKNIHLEDELTSIIAYKHIGNLLSIPPSRTNKVGSKLSNNYNCYMINSNNKVKKTELVVQKKNKCENIYEFKHKDYDGVSRRLISGPLLTMMKNTYLIGDIEEGEGIEFIALEEPISCDFDFLVGSAISLDQNRQAVSFKVICRPIASGKEFEPWEDILDIKDPQAADAINIQTDWC